jgi:predicted metal-dependent enzyme (double-stranded beta helix superfamily)
LVADIDGIVHGHLPPDRQPATVAASVERVLLEPDLLPPHARRSSAGNYRTNVVHVAADGSFSIVALVWRPGQATPIHSHRAWCVVGVHCGEEFETRYRLDPTEGTRCLRAASTQSYGVGQVTWLDAPHDIHRVENRGRELAISVHVYGTDYRRYGSSILETFASTASTN